MFSALLIFALALTASASPLHRRECDVIPSEADPAVRDAVYRLAKARGVNDKVLLSTFETIWIETHANNLPCGDQDSLGVFQQRPSMGWGTPEQLMNIEYATNMFLDRCIPNDAANPGFTPGQLAQSVQM